MEKENNINRKSSICLTTYDISQKALHEGVVLTFGARQQNGAHSNMGDICDQASSHCDSYSYI